MKDLKMIGRCVNPWPTKSITKQELAMPSQPKKPSNIYSLSAFEKRLLPLSSKKRAILSQPKKQAERYELVFLC
jgi:hypothetical protein